MDNQETIDLLRNPSASCGMERRNHAADTLEALNKVYEAAKDAIAAEKPMYEGIESVPEWWDFLEAIDAVGEME